MRVLRATAYLPDGNPLGTMVLRDSDVVDTLESIRERLLDDPDQSEIISPEQRPFIKQEIFSMADGGILAATEEAQRRSNEDRERNQSILYYYAVDFVLPPLKPDGVWITPDPAPLTIDEVEEALLQVARHPAYSHQTIVTAAEDGTRIALVDGTIERQEDQ